MNSWPHRRCLQRHATGARHQIEFEFDEFNRRFRVKCNEQKFAFALFDGQMMQWLLDSALTGPITFLPWSAGVMTHFEHDLYAQLQLMQVLADSGDVAGALQHARVYETLVRQEFDLPPDREVVALAGLDARAAHRDGRRHRACKQVRGCRKRRPIGC